MAKRTRTSKARTATKRVVIPRSATLEAMRQSCRPLKGKVSIHTIDGLMRFNESLMFDIANGASLSDLRASRQVASDNRKDITLMLACGFDPQMFFSKNLKTLAEKTISAKPEVKQKNLLAGQ